MRRQDIEKLNGLNERVKNKRALIGKVRKLPLAVYVGPVQLSLTDNQMAIVQAQLILDMQRGVNELDAEIYRVMEATDATN